MNLLAIVLGCITLNTLAFLLGMHSFKATLGAALLGIALGHGAAWLINKLATRELRRGRFSYLAQAPPQIPHMMEALTEDGVLYYRICLQARDGAIDQIKVPASIVSLRAAGGDTDPVFFERFNCIKNKFLALLAFSRNEFVDYQVIAPYDQLP